LNLTSTAMSARANTGGWSVLLQISGYNGLADDFDVEVALFPSPGLGGVKPKWDGTDAWQIYRSSVGDAGVSAPRYTSQGGYVSGGVLVASFPQAMLSINGSAGLAVELVGGVISGTLQRGPTGWSLTNGVIAGRWPTSQIFSSLNYLQLDAGPALCTSSVTFPYVKAAICSGADILANGSDPVSDPCDSFSFGAGFTADPAQIGPIAVPKAGISGCPAGTDPAGTTCP